LMVLTDALSYHTIHYEVNWFETNTRETSDPDNLYWVSSFSLFFQYVS
jgi:hypothetical protein